MIAVGFDSGRGFSLLEVVVAMGICAATVTAILMMLRPLMDATGEVRDTQAAVRIVGVIEAELRRMPLVEVAAHLNGEDWLYASTTGNRVGPFGSALWTGLGPTAAEQNAGKFFAISIRENVALSPADGEAAGSLLVTVHLRWPAHTGDGRPVSGVERQNVMLVPMAIAR